MTSARWYDLGRFRILAKPLETNPAWTTHHIYLGERCIGKQLSVPSLDDCEQLVCTNKPPTSTMKPFSFGRNLPRPGRPRKADAERELQEAIEAG